MTLPQPNLGIDRRCAIGDKALLSRQRKPVRSLSMALVPHLPELRRWSRTLAGSRHSGDAYIRATLSLILTGEATLIDLNAPRVSLYRLLYAIWSSASGQFGDEFEYNLASDLESSPGERLVRGNVALALIIVEGFTPKEADFVVGQARCVKSTSVSSRLPVKGSASRIRWDRLDPSNDRACASYR
jgi:hypothetical protein